MAQVICCVLYSEMLIEPLKDLPIFSGKSYFSLIRAKKYWK